MRGKRAKQLRRMAIQFATITKNKLVERQPLTPRRQSEKRSHVTLEWEAGCWKRLYRQLKKSYRGGAR